MTRLKGVLIYSPRRLIWNSGRQEGARLLRNFLISCFPDKIKSGQRGKSTDPEGGTSTWDAMATASGSEYRLQPEASEGLQAWLWQDARADGAEAPA
jgi:hypothetical protein